MPFGMVGIVAIAVVAIVVVALALFIFRSRLFGRRKGRERARSALLDHPRVEVLETKVIDEERKLVLIRCDQVEHLIMIGGAADLVVENDVKKVRPQTQTPAAARAPVAPPTHPAHAADNAARIPVATGASLEAAIAAAVPKAQEPSRACRAAPERAAASAADAAPAHNRAGAARGGPQQRARRYPPSAGRRLVPPPAMLAGATPRRAAPAPQAQQASMQAGRSGEPLRAPPASTANRQSQPGRGSSRAKEDAALPAAQVPWVEPDSIENEIVEALRFEPRARSGEAPPAPREPAKPVIDSSATLGDLADRLEEALAREIQSGGPAMRRAEPEAADFSFDMRSRGSPSLRSRSGRQGARKSAPSRRSARRCQPPEPEAKREPAPSPERREEAPVISLNARRREAADPLEDEMARLLGELTGDTKGR